MSELEIIDSRVFIGQDFLTWLLATSELNGGEFVLRRHGKFQLIFDQRVVLVGGGERVTWSGDLTSIDEIRLALRSGKKVHEAQFRLTQGDKEWRFTLDARLLQFRSVRTPHCSRANPLDFFFEKLDVLEELVSFVDELFAEFVRRRMEPEQWPEELARIRSWIEWQ
jgi:recombination associated protein RdgC